MICISRLFLRTIDVEITRHENGEGLFLSSLFSFGGGGNGGADTALLASEPDPRKLLLVGMSDRYGATGRMPVEVTEICVDSDRLAPRMPSSNELDTLITALRGCANPAAAEILRQLGLP